MPREAVIIAGAFLISFAAFLSAYFLAGQRRAASVYAAVPPAAAAAAVSALSGSPLVWPAIALTAALGLLCALRLTKRNLCVSSLTVLLAVSFCMSVQLVLSVTGTDTAVLVAAAGICLLMPLLLRLGRAVIFPSDYILTDEQRKNVFTRQVFFFPGPVLLICLQTLLLSPAVGTNLYLLVFALLLHAAVIAELVQQVRSFQERIESVIDKQYQAEVLSFMQVIRSQRHDFNFHMQTICGMIESGQYDECRDYVGSMMRTVRSTNDILPLYHPATGALLNTFREMALQKGLQMDIEIHDNLQRIASPVYETNTILGNLLQNAIDELELHPENESRVIRVLIIKRGRYNILKVSNQCHLPPEEMSRVFMPGFTTKRSHEGIGLANALRLSEKYGGTVYPEFEGSTVHFIAKIPLAQTSVRDGA